MGEHVTRHHWTPRTIATWLPPISCLFLSNCSVSFKCQIYHLHQSLQTSPLHRQNERKSFCLVTKASGRQVLLPGNPQNWWVVIINCLKDLCTIHSTIHIKPLLASIFLARLCIWRTGPSDYNYGIRPARSVGTLYISEVLIVEYFTGAVPFSDTFVYSRFLGSHRRLRHYQYATILFSTLMIPNWL